MDSFQVKPVITKENEVNRKKEQNWYWINIINKKIKQCPFSTSCSSRIESKVSLEEVTKFEYATSTSLSESQNEDLTGSCSQTPFVTTMFEYVAKNIC